MLDSKTAVATNKYKIYRNKLKGIIRKVESSIYMTNAQNLGKIVGDFGN